MKSRQMHCIVNRLRLVWAGLFLMGTLVLSCLQNQPLSIGFVAGLSGRFAALGIPGRNAVMLAVEQQNASGGIHGRPLQLVIQDDKQDPATARKIIQELIQKKLEVVIGPMTSSMAMEMVPIANRSETILMSPTVTTTQLQGRDDALLRVIDVTTQYAKQDALFQYAKQGHRKAAVIYDLNNAAYTRSWFLDFQQAFQKLGGKVVSESPYNSSQPTDFFQMVQTILPSKPDFLLIITSAFDAALICNQVRKIDQQVSISLSEWASTEQFIELAGKTAEGVYASQFLDRGSKNKRYLAFLEAYRERFGQEPGFSGVAAYDAAQVVIDALKRRKAGQPVKQAILARKTYTGLQEKIHIDRFGDANRKTYIAVIRNGRFITLE